VRNVALVWHKTVSMIGGIVVDVESVCPAMRIESTVNVLSTMQWKGVISAKHRLIFRSISNRDKIIVCYFIFSI